MATSTFVTLRNDPKRVVLGEGFEIEDEFLHSFFSNVRMEERNAAFSRALVFGAYALQEERIAAFLSTVETELDGRLEELKMLHKVRGLKEKAATKGVAAEEDIGTVLEEFFKSCKWTDTIVRTGEKVGTIPRRKVGDLVATIGGTTSQIVIEAKWAENHPLGDPITRLANPEKSAYGQNLTALINRDADISIFVTDKSVAHKSIAGATDGILLHPEIPGFVVIVDRLAGDWTNLKIAYAISRSLALRSSSSGELTDRTLLIVKRHLRDLAEALAIKEDLEQIESSANTITGSVEKIRTHLERSIASATRSEAILTRVLSGDEIPEIEWKHFLDESS